MGQGRGLTLMNYRHAFHAGNFADVVKHAVLVRLIEYLKLKDKGFRVIDTHAGRGLYNLASEQARKTGEWQGGIARLLQEPLAAPAVQLLQPYLDVVGITNPPGELIRYPGSPLIIRHLLRKQDRLTAIELHREDARALGKLFADDYQVRVIELDGWLALGAHLPPKEKRGLVIVDPPFEQAGEFDRLIDGLVTAHRRWPGGIYALWYPVKDRAGAAAFQQNLRQAGIPKILDIRLFVRGPSSEPRLDGSGLVVVNPPYTLESDLRAILPALQHAMAEAPGAGWTLEWLAGEAREG